MYPNRTITSYRTNPSFPMGIEKTTVTLVKEQISPTIQSGHNIQSLVNLSKKLVHLLNDMHMHTHKHRQYLLYLSHKIVRMLHSTPVLAHQGGGPFNTTHYTTLKTGCVEYQAVRVQSTKSPKKDRWELQCPHATRQS